MHVLVYSGEDSESQSVSPNQNVGRSSKFHVAPAPLALGRAFGSVGSVTVYVTSLPDPATADLNSIEGSSWPTYSSAGFSYASAQSDERLTQSGSSIPRAPAAFPRSAAWFAAVLVAESGTEAATNAKPASAMVIRANRFIEGPFLVETGRRIPPTPICGPEMSFRSLSPSFRQPLAARREYFATADLHAAPNRRPAHRRCGLCNHSVLDPPSTRAR